MLQKDRVVQNKAPCGLLELCAPAGRVSYQLLYRGRDSVYRDKCAGIHVPFPVPGNLAAPNPDGIEYCVSAVNENGGGSNSPTAHTNPASWRNWNPRPNEPFRRVYAFPPDSPESPGTEPRYDPQ